MMLPNDIIKIIYFMGNLCFIIFILQIIILLVDLTMNFLGSHLVVKVEKGDNK